MTQTWETKLTPEQEAAKVARIILFKDFLLDYHAGKSFSETFESLGDALPIMLNDPPHKWYAGTRLFLEDVAVELSFDGGNMQPTFFSHVLAPLWETVVGSIILMNATARMDDWTFEMHLRDVRSRIKTLIAYYTIEFPIVVVALKTKYEEQFSLEELRIILDPLNDEELATVPILLCDPTAKESVKEALLAVLQLYLDEAIDAES